MAHSEALAACRPTGMVGRSLPVYQGIVRTLSPDTDPRAEAVMIERFRRMTPDEKLARVFSLRAMTIELAKVRIRERHGALSEREERMRLASLWLDRATMQRVYGWDPKDKGY